MSKKSEYNDRIKILQIALHEANINLYDEILSYIWTFTYSKNVWRGLIDDYEGREFNIKINAFDSSQEGLNSIKLIKLEDFYIKENMNNIIITEVGRKAVEENFGLNLEDAKENIFLIYLLKSKKCVLYEVFSEKKYEIYNIEQEKIYENFIKSNCLVYYLCAKELNGYKKMFYDMDNKVIDLKDRKLFKGVIGLKKLCEDIKVFSRHGDEKWMSNITEIILDRLKIVANIREANCERILQNEAYFSDFTRNIEETCALWKKLKKEKEWSLCEIALALEEIIKFEQLVYKFSKSEEII